jgi:hypothetical protein
MIDASPTHPTLDQLTAFDRGMLADEEWETVEQHVASCGACGHTLEGLQGDVLATMIRAFSGSGISQTEADLCIPPELVGHPRYRLLRPLGAGGMGVVYLAVHRLMDRVVALKVVHRGLLDRPGAGERFRQEIRAAAQLSHPHIVTAYDADQAGDLHFLVMEFVEGTSLDRLVRDRPLDRARACAWVRQAALGLQHAYERGMVHRDIKPGNLLVTPDGRVKILDFGLARFVREHTKAGTDTPCDGVLGTPDYIAPEQARDPRRADIRADVYSLGCTLYHLLTGHPPFAGGTDLQKLIAHQEQRPELLTEVRPELPRELVTVLERMLAKDPSDRYQTPAEVARDLALLTGTPLSLPAAPASADRARLWRRRFFAGAAVLAVAGALGLTLRPPAGDQSRRAPQGDEVARPPDPGVADLDLLSARELAGRQKEARDRALAWIRDNDRRGPGSQLEAKVAAESNAGDENTEGFLLEIGANLVKSGKTTLLTARAGELAVFELTAAQTAAKPFPPSALRFRPLGQRKDQWRRRPPFTLSDLVINDADTLDGGRKITGSVAYRGQGPIPHELALRLTFFPGKVRRASFDYLNGQQVTASGSLVFSFGAVSFSHSQYVGPLVVFLELCSLDHARTPPMLVVESNTLTALVFISGSASPTARSSQRRPPR